MRLLDNLSKPEYVFRPSQMLLRWHRGRRPPRAEEVVTLPWGAQLAICPNENIGRQVWHMGVFDLTVTETLWRLLDPGELAVDVGANLGYMTSILAAKTGPAGKVWALEPHPQVFERLQANVARWRSTPSLGQVLPQPHALGERAGMATLWIPPRFEENVGLARLSSTPPSEGQTCAIEVVPLDDLLAASEKVGLMKVDVEGAELQVLQGARGALGRGQIRDVVFEDHAAYPSPVSRFLESLGFQVYSLRLRLWGLVVQPAAAPARPLRPWDSPNCLATRDPQRSLARLRPPGWRSLAGRG
jgi:FkbM family methyltransferase